jgi:hypothetical protein
MKQAIAQAQGGTLKMSEAIEAALIMGDLGKLGSQDRVLYYNSLCNSLGLNPLTKPFAYIVLNGKLQLYALKDCMDQIRNIKGVSVIDLVGKLDADGGIYTVTAKGQDKHGRIDAATGAVDVKGQSGEKRANSYMKAETKAKRRLTLSLCGLGMLDESEVDSIAGAKLVKYDDPPMVTRTEEPSRTVDERRQDQAGEEDQRPPSEQRVKPATEPSSDAGQNYLNSFRRQAEAAKTASEINEIWEAYRKLVDGSSLHAKRKTELTQKGWEIRKTERLKRAGA